MRMEPMSKEDKAGIIVSAVGLSTLLIACACMLTFTYRWDKTVEEYANVDYEWDDDRDRYDVFIDGIGHLTIPTNKATLVYLPTESTINLAVVRKEQTIFNKLTTYDLERFYINVGWKEELK